MIVKSAKDFAKQIIYHRDQATLSLTQVEVIILEAECAVWNRAIEVAKAIEQQREGVWSQGVTIALKAEAAKENP